MNPAFKNITSSKAINKFNVFITIATIISLAATGYWYFRNKLWRPKVSVLSVDWETGMAMVEVGNKQKQLYAGSPLSAGADWAVKFSNSPDGDEQPDRIELVRNDVVFNTLIVKPGTQAKAGFIGKDFEIINRLN